MQTSQCACAPVREKMPLYQRCIYSRIAARWPCQGAAPCKRAARASMLGGLAKARHPAAKAATQTPAKQEVTKKRSCNADKPISIRTNEEENASLRKGAPALAALRGGPAKKQRSAKGPRALPLRPISTYKRHGETARTQSPTRHRRLKSITGFSSRRRLSTSRPLAPRAGHTSSARPRLA